MPYLAGPVSLILLAALLMLLPPHYAELLQYQREAILHGQLWRLLSGDFLHTNAWHLAMNCGGVVAIAWLHGRYYDFFGWWLRVLYLALASSVILLLAFPDLHWYLGLSGLLHGLIVIGAGEDIRRGEKTGYLLLLGVAAKVTWEQWHGPSAQIAALINAPVATQAHLAGAVAALPWLLHWKKQGA
ncbi:rhombosortase [Gallaecimonas sp. GXIMD1310]|uniref:rhombosortase n=1 Tax=Gallaecimonas sp. GXIMD1310 TaxID=3131926 RepID=UPI00324903E4